MKMRFKLTLRMLLILAIFYSCRSGVNPKAFVMADRAEINSSPSGQESDGKIGTPVERKIIKQGEIRFETRNVKETESLISKAVSDLGGYISNDNVYNNEDRITHRMVIRVPADNFDKLLTNISESAEKLDSKSVDALDVTEEYIDVESRIRTKKELENRYRELLVKANTVQDILSIEKEIGSLRTEIESIEKRLQYLNDHVSFSALTVEYYQMTSSSFNFSSKFGQALLTGWKWLLAFLIGLIHLWPFILIIGGGIFVCLRLNKKKRKLKQSTNMH
jgi:hypothetical protein